MVTMGQSGGLSRGSTRKVVDGSVLYLDYGGVYTDQYVTKWHRTIHTMPHQHKRVHIKLEESEQAL